MLQPLNRATWAPRGQTPILDAWDRHDRYTAIGGLVFDPIRDDLEFYFHLLDHNARGEDFMGFVDQLHTELDRKLIVVWDRLAAHRKADRLLSDFGRTRVHFEYLPPYCPQLNPVEHVWEVAKWCELANWAPAGRDELQSGVEQELIRQATDEWLLRSHFHWAGLDLDVTDLRH